MKTYNYIPSPGLEDATADAFVRRDWPAYVALTRQSHAELTAFHASAGRYAQASELRTATVAAAPDPPPSLADAVRAARSGSPSQGDDFRAAGLAVLAAGERPVAPAPHRQTAVALATAAPPSLTDAIRAARAKEVR